MERALNISINYHAFYWFFPELVAEHDGLFKGLGIVINWNDATPVKRVNKSELYGLMLSSGKTDLYHCGEWVGISRTYPGGKGRIVAKSTPAHGTLNSTFVLFVRAGSGIERPEDLAGVPIAIESGTGSYYTSYADLEKYVPRGMIRLVDIGEPYERLLALLEGKVGAASLVGPYVDLAERLGLVKVLETSRTNPTLIIFREGIDKETIRLFFRAINEAVNRINSRPNNYRQLYFQMFSKVFEHLTPSVREAAEALRDEIRVPRWSFWEPYTVQDFESTYRWMLDKGLIGPGGSAEAQVDLEAYTYF